MYSLDRYSAHHYHANSDAAASSRPFMSPE
jgi:hypothetical protein